MSAAAETNSAAASTPAKNQGEPAIDASFHTPCTVTGALPTSAAELKAMGNTALQQGEYTKACHVYTLAIDLLSHGLLR
eukprot:SAG11_NODE_12746_length_687_cov_1.137755_1_plen_79_part_00